MTFTQYESAQVVTRKLRAKNESISSLLPYAKNLLHGELLVYLPHKELFLLEWVLDRSKDNSDDISLARADPNFWNFFIEVWSSPAIKNKSLKARIYQKSNFLNTILNSLNDSYNLLSSSNNSCYSSTKAIDLLVSLQNSISLLQNDNIFLYSTIDVQTDILTEFLKITHLLSIYSLPLSTFSFFIQQYKSSLYGLSNYKKIAVTFSSKALKYVALLLGQLIKDSHHINSDSKYHQLFNLLNDIIVQILFNPHIIPLHPLKLNLLLAPLKSIEPSSKNPNEFILLNSFIPYFYNICLKHLLFHSSEQSVVNPTIYFSELCAISPAQSHNLLQITYKRKLFLSEEVLSNIFSQTIQRENAPWILISDILNLNVNIIQKNQSLIFEKLSSISKENSLSFSTSLNFLIHLINSYADSRQLSIFISSWIDVLKNLPNNSSSSIWENNKVVNTVAKHVVFEFTPHKLKQLLNTFNHSLSSMITNDLSFLPLISILIGISNFSKSIIDDLYDSFTVLLSTLVDSHNYSVVKLGHNFWKSILLLLLLIPKSKLEKSTFSFLNKIYEMLIELFNLNSTSISSNFNTLFYGLQVFFRILEFNLLTSTEENFNLSISILTKLLSYAPQKDWDFIDDNLNGETISTATFSIIVSRWVPFLGIKLQRDQINDFVENVCKLWINSATENKNTLVCLRMHDLSIDHMFHEQFILVNAFLQKLLEILNDQNKSSLGIPVLLELYSFLINIPIECFTKATREKILDVSVKNGFLEISSSGSSKLHQLICTFISSISSVPNTGCLLENDPKFLISLFESLNIHNVTVCEELNEQILLNVLYNVLQTKSAAAKSKYINSLLDICISKYKISSQFLHSLKPTEHLDLKKENNDKKRISLNLNDNISYIYVCRVASIVNVIVRREPLLDQIIVEKLYSLDKLIKMELDSLLTIHLSLYFISKENENSVNLIALLSVLNSIQDLCSKDNKLSSSSNTIPFPSNEILSTIHRNMLDLILKLQSLDSLGNYDEKSIIRYNYSIVLCRMFNLHCNLVDNSFNNGIQTIALFIALSDLFETEGTEKNESLLSLLVNEQFPLLVSSWNLNTFSELLSILYTYAFSESNLKNGSYVRALIVLINQLDYSKHNDALVKQIVTTFVSGFSRYYENIPNENILINLLEAFERILRNQTWIVSQYILEQGFVIISKVSSPIQLISSKMFNNERIFLCFTQILSTILLFHRHRLNDRHHLVNNSFKHLLLCLFQPDPLKFAQSNMAMNLDFTDTNFDLNSKRDSLLESSIPKSFVEACNVSSARAFVRILNNLCEPPTSSIRERKGVSKLTSASTAEKRVLSNHIPYIIMSYIFFLLYYKTEQDVQETLSTGFHSAFDILSNEEMKILSASLDYSGRLVLRKIYAEYLKHGKWNDE